MTNRFFFTLLFFLLAVVLTGCPAPEDEIDRGFNGSVYYSLEGSIRRIDLSTGTIVTVAPGIAPTITSQGKIIAVINGEGLVEYSSDGSGKRTIIVQDKTQSGEIYDDLFIDPQLSADGRYIAYEGRGGSIYIIERNGVLVNSVGDFMRQLKRPQWLPTGEIIVEGSDGLYKVTAQFRLEGRIGPQSEIRQHSISPDGKKIAAMIDGEVRMMNVDGTDPQRMMSGNSVQYPAWSSSGKHIVVKDGCDLKLFPIDAGMVASFRGRFFSYKDTECPDEYQIDWQ